MGNFSQNDEDPELEHFGLFWPGKRDARKAASLVPEGNLEPVFGDGLKADGEPDTNGENDSKNIFIEGENLEVLKLLQKRHRIRKYLKLKKLKAIKIQLKIRLQEP